MMKSRGIYSSAMAFPMSLQATRWKMLIFLQNTTKNCRKPTAIQVVA